MDVKQSAQRRDDFSGEDKARPLDAVLESEKLLLTDNPAALTDQEPATQDGGWGWVICLASFIVVFTLEGVGYSFGIFLDHYAEYFNSSVKSTSLASSLLYGVYSIVAPVVGALINKYGYRTICIAGCLTTSFVLVLSTFSPSIVVFQLVYGVMGGVGFCMVGLSTMIAVSVYFTKKRALATGLAMSGTGIGVFALAPFSRFLLDHFDWRGTHYILAGLVLQCCVFAALIRPLKRSSQGHLQSHSNSTSSSQSIEKSIAQQVDYLPSKCHILSTSKQATNRDLENPLQHDRKVTCSAEELHSPTKANYGPRLHASVYVGSHGSMPSDRIQHLRRPMYNKDVFYSGSIDSLHMQTEESLLESDSSSGVKALESPHRCLRCLPKSVADIVTEMTDVKVLKSKVMLLLCGSCFFVPLGYYVPVLFSTSRAIRYGVSEEQAALLLSILGICNTAGRVLFGILVVFTPGLSALLLNNICMVVTSLSVLLTPFCTTFPLMALAIATYGLFSASFMSLMTIIICDLIGVDKLTNAYGIICMIRGISSAIGSPIGGQLYDVTEDYDATFYMGGACMLLGCSLSWLLHLSVFQSNKNLSKT